MGVILQPDKKVSQGMAVAVLILNIIPGGIGSIIYGRILRGVLEFLLSWTIVAWIISVVDGVQVMTKAVEKGPAKSAATP